MTFSGHGMMLAGTPTIASGYVERWLSNAGVTTVSGAISQWVGTNGNPFSQATATSRTLHQTVEGVLCAWFDGVDDAMIGPDVPAFGVNGKSEIVVQALVRAGNAGGVAFFNQRDAGDWGGLIFGLGQSSLTHRFGVGSGGSDVAVGIPAVWGWRVVTIRKNGTSEYAYLNKSLANTRTGAVATMANTTSQPRLDAWYSSAFVGGIAELLVYHTDIGHAAIQTNVDAIAAIHGLTF